MRYPNELLMSGHRIMKKNMRPLPKLGAGMPMTSFKPVVYGVFCPPDFVREFALLVVVEPVPTAVNLDKIA